MPKVSQKRSNQQEGQAACEPKRNAIRAGANPPMAPALIGAALAGATPSD